MTRVCGRLRACVGSLACTHGENALFRLLLSVSGKASRSANPVLFLFPCAVGAGGATGGGDPKEDAHKENIRKAVEALKAQRNKGQKEEAPKEVAVKPVKTAAPAPKVKKPFNVEDYPLTKWVDGVVWGVLHGDWGWEPLDVLVHAWLSTSTRPGRR